MTVTLFISDLHLSPENPGITDCLIRFLKREADRADGLYILGDLFEFWVGDDLDDSFTRAVIEALRSWPKPLYLMHGNRDFLMGQEFADKIHANLLPDPYVINLYGEPVLITHGDLLCTRDKSYLRFRKLARKPWLQKLFLKLSLKFRLKLAGKLRQESHKYISRLDSHIMDADPKEIQKWLELHKVRRMIHGHTHKPELSPNRAVLPAWHEQGGVLECYPEGQWKLAVFS